MRPSLSAALVFAICASAYAQTSEVIEVRVTNVDVVVTDRSGKPITALTRDDFQLFENGKLQPITNFSEIRADLAPAVTPTEPDAKPASVVASEARRRSILVFIDNTSVPQFRRNQAVQAVRRGLDKLLRPGDDAMIVNWNRSPEVLQSFTGDRAALEKAIVGVEKRLSGASWMDTQKTQVISYAQSAISMVSASRGRYTMAMAYGDSTSAWRTYAQLLRKTEKNMLEGMGQMLASLTGMESKKVVIFIGGQLQEQPGVDVLQLINSLFENAGYRAAMPAMMGGLDMTVSEELRKLGHLANADGVTIYMIDASDRMRDSSMAGLPDRDADFIAESSTLLSMDLIASATGGSVLSGTKNFDVSLNNVARDLGSYYSLGYKPSADGGVDRRLRVKVSREGATVRSRQGYSMKTATEQMQDRVVANVFHEGIKGDFDVAIETGTPEKYEGSFKVPIKLSFSSNLTYIPDGGDLTGGYKVFFVTAGRDGAISQVGRQEQAVRFPAASFFSITQKPFTHTATLVVRPGRQSVSIAVVDSNGDRTGYAKATIEVK